MEKTQRGAWVVILTNRNTYLCEDEGSGPSDIFILLDWLFNHHTVNERWTAWRFSWPSPKVSRPSSPSLPQSCFRAHLLQAVIFLLCAGTSHGESFLGCVYHKYPPTVTSTLGSDHLRVHNPLLRVSADRKVRKISPCFSTINLAKPISRLVPQCSDMIMVQRLLRRD